MLNWQEDQLHHPKTKNPDRGHVFGIKTIAGEYVCQACMSPAAGQLNGSKIEELKEMIDCTICGAWVDYAVVEV